MASTLMQERVEICLQKKTSASKHLSVYMCDLTSLSYQGIEDICTGLVDVAQSLQEIL